MPHHSPAPLVRSARRRLVLVLLATLALALVGAGRAHADPSSMSDADFFAKIDLDYNAYLSANVKPFVLRGDYATAKEHLLDYYQQRSGRGFVDIDNGETNTAGDILAHRFRSSARRRSSARTSRGRTRPGRRPPSSPT